MAGSTSSEAATYRFTGKPYFTDKLPNNFSHVGLIHLILPNAKVINARRHPFDSCLGAYKQLFGKGQHFTYDMSELPTTTEVPRDMQHWHRVLPGKVLDVHYEETVTDLEMQVRRILAHCGLPFEEGCVRFHETERAVRRRARNRCASRSTPARSATGATTTSISESGKRSWPTSSNELPEVVRDAGIDQP